MVANSHWLVHLLRYLVLMRGLSTAIGLTDMQDAAALHVIDCTSTMLMWRYSSTMKLWLNRSDAQIAGSASPNTSSLWVLPVQELLAALDIDPWPAGCREPRSTPVAEVRRRKAAAHRL